MRMKIIAAIIFVAVCCGPLGSVVVFAATASDMRKPIIYVKRDGVIISDDLATVTWPVASITKLMTAMVLTDMNLDWSKSVSLMRSDEVGGARLRSPVGTRYSRNDLLHASLMGSANNATHALARTSGVSLPYFVAQMNKKALALGMVNTHFVDPTGIEIENVSTAEDLAKLVEAAGTYPSIAKIGTTDYFTLYTLAKRSVAHPIKTTNKLLLNGDSVQLGKTGYLIESQYNFAMIGTDKTGAHQTVVVLGAPSMNASFQIARAHANMGD